MTKEAPHRKIKDEYEDYYRQYCIECQQEINEELQDPNLTKPDLVVRAVHRLLDEEWKLSDLIHHIRGEKPREPRPWQIEGKSFAEILERLPEILNDLAMRAFTNNANLYRAIYLPSVATYTLESPEPEASERTASK